MKKIAYLASCFILVAMIGCREDNPVSSKKTSPSKDTTDQQVESKTLSYDYIVKPIGGTIKKDFFAENSDPVDPGVKIDIIDNSLSPPRVIVSGTTAQYVRWKVKGPFMAPKYPASGFVTLNLTENQWEALRDKDIVIKRSSK